MEKLWFKWHTAYVSGLCRPMGTGIIRISRLSCRLIHLDLSAATGRTKKPTRMNYWKKRKRQRRQHPPLKKKSGKNALVWPQASESNLRQRHVTWLMNSSAKWVGRQIRTNCAIPRELALQRGAISPLPSGLPILRLAIAAMWIMLFLLICRW